MKAWWNAEAPNRVPVRSPTFVEGGRRRLCHLLSRSSRMPVGRRYTGRGDRERARRTCFVARSSPGNGRRRAEAILLSEWKIRSTRATIAARTTHRARQGGGRISQYARRIAGSRGHRSPPIGAAARAKAATQAGRSPALSDSDTQAMVIAVPSADRPSA